MQESFIRRMVIAYNDFSPNTFFSYRDTTLMDISNRTTKIATILCLSNYEIALWQYHFLRIWLTNPVQPYIYPKDFFEALKVKYIDIFQKYYDTFTYDNIITFIWIFVFTNVDVLVKILLSIHGIQTNISITHHQALEFFTSLNPEAKKHPYVEDWMDLHEQDDGIKINDVVDLVSKSHCLTIYLKDLKEKLIQQFVSLKGYIIIQRRMTYYNNLFDEGVFKEPPKENIFSKLKRIVITKKPPPYYSNYRSNNTDYIQIYGDLISSLRKDFGYCKRPETYANPMLFSKTTSMNSTLALSTPKDVNICIDE